MLWSELAIATLREDNHPLLVRAGYMRGREYLFLGQRALAKITAILRCEGTLERCGVAYIAAGEDFMAESDSGGEILVRGTNYAALAAKAVSIAQPPLFRIPKVTSSPKSSTHPA